ncbi:MAG: AtpZ/AtpI family protein [bacterium]|nr:AtpZ/AtpI family protein [bacterium]
MSDEQITTLSRLEALIEDIESDIDNSSLAKSDISPDNASNSSGSPKNGGSANGKPTDTHLADKVIDITRHPLGKRSWLPDTVLKNADSKFEGLSDEIWDRLTKELDQVRPMSDGPMTSNTLSSELSSEDSSVFSEKPDATSQNVSDIVESDTASPTPAPSEAPSAHEDRDAQKLDDIQKRIDSYWEKHTPKPNTAAHSLGAVLSLGFVMAAVLYSAYLIGQELVSRSGQSWLLPLCLIIGMAAGFYIGFTLLHPLIKKAPQEKKAAPSSDTAGDKKT